jgi:DNA-binding phage protein
VIGRFQCAVVSRQLMDAMENDEMTKASLALRRGFKETILARVQRDPKFRNALLKEGFETLLAGDVDTGKAILRDYIKATVGFEQLGAETGSSPKSLIRMSGPSGNPQARNLFAVISHLQRDAGLTLHVTARAQ